MSGRPSRRHVRLATLALVVVAVCVLAIVFSHGLAVRLAWGASGFAAGLVCGMLLMAEIHHRRHARREGRHHDADQHDAGQHDAPAR